MGKIHVSKADINGIEHLHSNTTGFAPRSRVEHAIKEGLLVFDKERGDYGFTYKTLDYQNFWVWLQGTENELRTGESNF